MSSAEETPISGPPDKEQLRRELEKIILLTVNETIELFKEYMEISRDTIHRSTYQSRIVCN